GGISASSLSFPTGLSFDLAGHLWAADPGNNRTLEFPVPNSAQPAISAAAVAILGQRGSATTNGFDNAGLDGGAQASPSSLSFDAADDTFISDFGNNRAIELQDPTVSISKGWNLISIPVRNNTLVTPSDVVNSLDTALGSSSAVGALSTYANGRF